MPSPWHLYRSRMGGRPVPGRPACGPGPAGALVIDVRAVDAAGRPAWMSLALAPAGVRPLFDDPAVSWALRQVLAGPAREVLSTLTLDSASNCGALTAVRAAPPLLLLD